MRIRGGKFVGLESQGKVQTNCAYAEQQAAAKYGVGACGDEVGVAAAGGVGRCGPPMYPFDAGERDRLAPIRRDDKPGKVGGVKKPKRGMTGERSNSNSRSSSSNSAGWNGRTWLDGRWHGPPTFPFDPVKTRSPKACWWT